LAVDLLVPSVQVAVPPAKSVVHEPWFVPVLMWNEPEGEQFSVVPAFCTGTCVVKFPKSTRTVPVAVGGLILTALLLVLALRRTSSAVAGAGAAS